MKRIQLQPAYREGAWSVSSPRLTLGAQLRELPTRRAAIEQALITARRRGRLRAAET